jgi:hypothetical protein
VGVLTGQSGKRKAWAKGWLALAAVLSLVSAQQPASANDDARTDDEAVAPAVPGGNSYEIWAGGDATRRYASIWTGLTWAPFGSIQESGWRLRGVTGGGRYAYDGWRIVGGLPTPAHFKAVTLFGDALVGYQLQIGSLTVKPFAGISMVDHRSLPFDSVSRINGRTLGAKLALDTWWAVGPSLWLSVDGSWSQIHETTSVRGRVGYRLIGDFSAGVEASTLSDVNQEMRRAGLFVRYTWERGEVSLGGGVSGRSWDDAARRAEPYANVTLLGRF